ncbi:MAG: hypothetical protein ACRDCC_02255 [Culicoidibacterales bacterium]
MQKINHQQIFQVMTGLLAILGFFLLIDYPITSSVIIANFIILLLSPTQQVAKANIRGQFLAQIIGISLGLILAVSVANNYLAVMIILSFVFLAPIWLKIKVPALPLAIAAYVIFQSEVVGEASVERIVLKIISLSIALLVAWLFSQRYSESKAKVKIYQQFLQVSQRVHELLWRSQEERQTLKLPESLILTEITLQSVAGDEQIFILLNQTLQQLERELQLSPQGMPLPAQQELLYALRIHHDYVQQYQAGTLITCFPYEIPETAVTSTWEASKTLALVMTYLQQLSQVSRIVENQVKSNQ